MKTQYYCPYQLLGVNNNASDEEIRVAFHNKLSMGEDNEAVRWAYSTIKNSKGRRNHRFLEVEGLIAMPPISINTEKGIVEDFEELIKELAFLNEWEAGVLQENTNGL